jgi:glutamate dehydrogenase (NADP+)
MTQTHPFKLTSEEVDSRLKEIMVEFTISVSSMVQMKKDVNYVKGANIAGFVKVADAMLAQGVV